MPDKNPDKIIQDLTEEEEKVEVEEEEKPETKVETETKEETKVEEKGDDKPETLTFDERIDSLAKDEQTAIDAYNKAIEAFADESHVVEQLQKIKKEEEDHLAYLEKVKGDHSLVYTDTGGDTKEE